MDKSCFRFVGCLEVRSCLDQGYLRLHSQNFISFETYEWVQQARVLHCTGQSRFATDKYSGLLEQFISYKEKKCCEYCPIAYEATLYWQVHQTLETHYWSIYKWTKGLDQVTVLEKVNQVNQSYFQNRITSSINFELSFAIDGTTEKVYKFLMPVS
jgi:hypothetical protein